MAGYQVGSVCYPSQEAAAAASVSDLPGQVFSAEPTCLVSYNAVIQGAGASTQIRFEPSRVGGSSCTASALLARTNDYKAQACQLVDVDDALAMGWVVVAAWVGIYALRLLANVVRGRA